MRVFITFGACDQKSTQDTVHKTKTLNSVRSRSNLIQFLRNLCLTNKLPRSLKVSTKLFPVVGTVITSTPHASVRIPRNDGADASALRLRGPATQHLVGTWQIQSTKVSLKMPPMMPKLKAEKGERHIQNNIIT